MVTRKMVEDRVAALGCTLDLSGSQPIRGDVWAPPGWCFDQDLHSLVAHQDPGCKASEVWSDLLERMETGLIRCDTPNCDTCTDHETGERVRHLRLVS